MKQVFFICLLLISFWGEAQQVVLGEINQLITTKEYAHAEKLLVENLKTFTSKELKNKLGEVYALQEKWDDAVTIYKELTEEYPKEAEYHFRYGGVLVKKAQYSNKFRALMLLGKIKSSFIKASQLDKNHIATRWALVEMYVSLPGIVGGSKTKAYYHANELRKVSAMDGYLTLGYVYEYDNAPEKAKESYIRALGYLDDLKEIERNQLNYQIGKVCGDYGLQLEKGIVHMQQYIDDFLVIDGVPLEWAYYRMARLHRKSKNKQLADKWIRKALQNRPQFKRALKEQQLIKTL
ncbi:MAG: hypothetical protein COA50_12660 [Flavobacteriaceae bacterium]|nr:MAG: hypothetical protein COA50_12660 [Flavobacteriaceae bacterium]